MSKRKSASTFEPFGVLADEEAFEAGVPAVEEIAAEPSSDSVSKGQDPASDEFIGPDGKRYRKVHEQRGSGWIDKTVLVG